MNMCDLTKEEAIHAIIVVKFSSVRKTCGITHRCIRVSTGLACDVCGKGFNVKQDFIKHIDTHG